VEIGCGIKSFPTGFAAPAAVAHSRCWQKGACITTGSGAVVEGLQAACGLVNTSSTRRPRRSCGLTLVVGVSKSRGEQVGEPRRHQSFSVENGVVTVARM